MFTLSPIQKDVLKNSNARLNFLIGAVRSGKTFISLMRWLEYIQTAPPGNLVMVGRTATTIKHNIVDEICNFVGSDAKYYVGKGELNLWGRRIYLIGASDERAETKIRGSTFAGAYIDEATLLPESFWVMLLSRLSVKGAQLFITTNPDSPFHYIKKKYIDRSDLDMKIFEFKLEDNPSLTESFKANLKKEYTGLWYKRYIEGQWCLAEGTIYDFFEESIHTIGLAPTNPKYYIVGVDYGTTNPCAFGLFGYNPDIYPNIWLEEEYYWDSREKMRQKTDSEYAEDLKKFIKGKIVKAVIIDPSAASFKAECAKQGIENLMDADNDVLNGIRFTSQMISNGTLKICRKCQHMLKEIQTYVWDEKSIKLGEDRPLKQTDHCFVGETLVSTDEGQVAIKDIQIGDRVLTPDGYKMVLKTFEREAEVYEYEILGQKIKCTPEHRFYTANRGWVKVESLVQSDIFLTNISEDICRIQSNGMELNITKTYPPKMKVVENIIEHIKEIALKDMGCSIEICGNSIMETFPKATIFITKMAIPQTMTLTISNVFQLLNIFPNIWQILLKNKEKLEKSIAKKLDLSLKNGIDHEREGSGIENIQLRTMKKESQKNLNAHNVGKNSKQPSFIPQNFVRITVNLNGEEKLGLMMSLEYVSFVLKNLKSISIQNQNAVQEHVQEKIELKLLDTSLQTAHSARKSLELMERKESSAQNHVRAIHVGKRKVYSLNVEDFHVYYVNNILVLNCMDATRYVMQTYFRPIYEGAKEMDVTEYRNWKAEQGWR